MPPPLHFRSRHRLSLDRDYQSVFRARVRTTRGPITVFASPNQAGNPRLGLTIGRRFGSATARVALKRRLREAFRQSQHELPQPYDYVITARAHRALSPARYAAQLISAARWLERQWERRSEETGDDQMKGSGPG